MAEKYSKLSDMKILINYIEHINDSNLPESIRASFIDLARREIRSPFFVNVEIIPTLEHLLDTLTINNLIMQSQSLPYYSE